MTRELHTRDICSISTRSLQAELDDLLDGDVVVIAPEDDRLKSVVPIKGQATLFGTQLDFDDDIDFYTAPLHNSHQDQAEFLPHTNSERFHFETNSYDTILSIFSLCGYFQRSSPFLDMTRIARSGGKIISITGLQPESPPDHDAKYWVPSSNDANLDELRMIRTDGFKTPVILSVFTVTSSTPRNPDATIVTNGGQA